MFEKAHALKMATSREYAEYGLSVLRGNSMTGAPIRKTPVIHLLRKMGVLRLQRIIIARQLTRFFNSAPQGVPFVLNSFNNPTYVKRAIEQVRKFNFSSIIIVDSGSTYGPMKELLRRVEREGVYVVRLRWNGGCHWLFQQDISVNAMPEVFAYSDPDVEFNPHLPVNFVDTLLEISRAYSVGKVGFALDISEPERMNPSTFLMPGNVSETIFEWESRFWGNPLKLEGCPDMYVAPIDTTFALYNREYFRVGSFFDAIRVAGDFTARHLPWYLESVVSTEELDFYLRRSRQSHY